jgi:glucose-6-phosphate isomerase
MRVRIVDDGSGGWKQIDNPDWRMRDAATIADLYGDEKKEATA